MITYVESTVSLGIQIVVLCLLIGAVFLKTHKKYRQHGIVMFSAVVLHIVSILAVMVPSFRAYVGPGSNQLFRPLGDCDDCSCFCWFYDCVVGYLACWILAFENRCTGMFQEKAIYGCYSNSVDAFDCLRNLALSGDRWINLSPSKPMSGQFSIIV